MAMSKQTSLRTRSDNDWISPSPSTDTGSEYEDSESSDSESTSESTSSDSEIDDGKIAKASRAELTVFVHLLLKKIATLESKMRNLQRRDGDGDDDEDCGLRAAKRKKPNPPAAHYVVQAVPEVSEIETLHPVVHPEIPATMRNVLEEKKAPTRALNKDRLYYPALYQDEDLDFITIRTLPSNGLEKPMHDGPKGDAYYVDALEKITSNLSLWVAKYFFPLDRPADICSENFHESLRGTVEHTDFFSADDKPEKKVCLYRAFLFSVVAKEIFEPWLSAIDGSAVSVIQQELGVDKEFLDESAGKRAQYFTNHVRYSSPPGQYYEKLYTDCFVLTRRLIEVFTGLFAFTANPNPSREVLTSCERELFLMLSECYALQVMFQSEKVMYRVVFAKPGQPFDPESMKDVTSEYLQARPRLTLPNSVPRYVDVGLLMGLYRCEKVQESGYTTVKSAALIKHFVTLRHL